MQAGGDSLCTGPPHLTHSQPSPTLIPGLGKRDEEEAALHDSTLIQPCWWHLHSFLLVFPPHFLVDVLLFESNLACMKSEVSG